MNHLLLTSFNVLLSTLSLQAQQADTIAAAAKPVPVQAEKVLAKRNESFERVKQLHARQAQYLKDAAEGKIVSFPEVQKNWPSYIKKFSDLTYQWNDSLKIKDIKKRDELHKPIFAALQPLGWLLKSAGHPEDKSYKIILTKPMQAELERLELAYEQAQTSSVNKGSFKMVGFSDVYTLQGLKVDLNFLAPPNSRIILQAENGGHFVNTRLPYTEIKSDDQGLASAQWVTYGDAVADCFLTAQCSASTDVVKPSVTVVQLVPNPPFELANVTSKKPINKTAAPTISQ